MQQNPISAYDTLLVNVYTKKKKKINPIIFHLSHLGKIMMRINCHNRKSS